MKTIFRLRRFATLSLILGLMFFGYGGCGDDPVDPNDRTIAPLTVIGIIANPKSPAPGDTVLITASIASDSLNTGEFPTLSWTSTGGTLLESNQLTIRWVAPLTSQLYTLTVQAANKVSNSSLSHTIFVGEPAMLVPDEAGELHATAGGDSIYYLTSPYNPTDALFSGFYVNLYIQGTGSVPVSIAHPGLEYSFSTSLTGAAHSVLNNLGGFITSQPINIYYDDLVTHTQTQVTFDQMSPVELRHTQYTTPAMSADGSLIAYELFFPFVVAGVVDTFDVNLYSLNTSTETNVTARHGVFRKNYYPTISTDGNWLMFVSDRTAQLVWEYYGLPITAGSVPLDSAAVVRITNTGGKIGNDLEPAEPMTDWNPDPTVSVLAVTNYQGALYIVDPNAQTHVVVGLDSKLRDFKWSDSGDFLAASTGANLYIIDYSTGVLGDVDLVYESQPGDIILDIAWSRDSNFLIYRVRRSSSIWYELYDHGGSTGLTQPVIITSAFAQGSLDDYLDLMSTRPAWSAAGEVFFLLFGSSTPGLYRLDLSGVIQ